MVKYCENNRGLPGTRYDFTLYYTNSTILDFPALKASIITAPDAPTNLSITVEDGEVATVNWDPPAVGQHSAFKLKLIPLSGTGKTVRNIVIRYN